MSTVLLLKKWLYALIAKCSYKIEHKRYREIELYIALKGSLFISRCYLFSNKAKASTLVETKRMILCASESGATLCLQAISRKDRTRCYLGFLSLTGVPGLPNF